MATAVNVSATNNAEIDGLLSGYKWSGTITYSFPDAASDYASSYSGGSGEPTTSGFASAPSQMQAAINYAIGLILGYTNANIQYAGTNGADIMVAQSPAANPTSYAYYPSNYASGGDVWFGTQYNYSQAALGNYYFTTALHELGHALGLKHSQEAGGPANVAVPSAHDDSEYSVMSYRSYVGASTTSGYTNEAYGYPQTYMANDILALQAMYGADYTTQGGTTVYTWSPTTGQEFINGAGQPADNGGAGGSANRIYETIWDGGGVDTYDLSNYTTNLSINLNPGASSLFSSVQLANLGNGHYASGNVYNAYLYNGDARSYIDNAIGGSGNDTIIGNAIANTLNGGAGNDTITGGGGNDTITGGSGTDIAVYSGNRANYAVSYNATTQTFTFVDLRSGSPDGIDAVTEVENFQFADGTLSSTTLISQLAPVTIEAIGATSLVQHGGNYFLDPTAGGTSTSLKYGGSVVNVSEFGAWTPIGAEQTASGYEIAWKSAGTDQYGIWTTDRSGNFASNTATMSGNSAAFESFEGSFYQDLNGDGIIGIFTSVVEALGSTSLVQVGNNYFLNPVAGGAGPSLKYGGISFVTGQVGAWMPIGAEQTASGYEIAWKLSGTDQYGIWTTDSSGNFVSNTGSMSGSSAAFESFETSFHQDLNGDGIVGNLTSTIEALGSTSLVQVGNNYFLNPVAGGTGPSLKYGGTSFVTGQFGAWMPIGAEQTASGYEIAWKLSGSDQYGIWNTDGGGNFVSNTGSMSGSSAAFESFETSLHQDLNGDGIIGPMGGAASRARLQNAAASGSSDQFFDWKWAGAEVNEGGSKAVRKVPDADQHDIWKADGTSPALKSHESSFHEDLNRKSMIDIATVPIHEELGQPRLLLQDASSALVLNGHYGTGQQDLHSAVLIASTYIIH